MKQNRQQRVQLISPATIAKNNAMSKNKEPAAFERKARIRQRGLLNVYFMTTLFKYHHTSVYLFLFLTSY